MEHKPFQPKPTDLDDEKYRALKVSEASHQAKMEDESRAGVPSYDESLVSDWIRNRVDIPEDMLKGGGVFNVEAIKQPEGDYEADFRKLKALTRQELDEILTVVENKSKQGRGLMSRGRLLNGYAIDRQTLESLQSSYHDVTTYKLEKMIEDRLLDSGVKPSDIDSDAILRRIIPGFVYLEIPGFKTPILKLYLGDKEMGDEVPEGEDIERIVRHLKGERKLLPITSDFRPL